MNGSTIFEDYAEAMNMMSPDMQAAEQLSLKATNYLAKVAAVKARSWLEFDQKEGARIVARSGLNAQVRLIGNIVFDTGAGPTSKPFDITLETVAVARNTTNTSGLEILSRKDN